AKYVDYYNGTRVQRDACAPAEEAPEPRDSAVAEPGTMVEVPRVGGLHHEYRRRPIAGISGVRRTVSETRGRTRSSSPFALAGRYQSLSRLTKIGLAASRLAP